MKVLGIETSCDETSAAIVRNGSEILSNVVASQVELHARYGGVVPEVASRQHLLSSLPILERSLKEAGCTLADISAVAVAHGPGLAGSLLVGVNLAKSLALAHSLPLIGVNHLEGHIYANWLADSSDVRPEFPLLSLIVSGGHTDLVLMNDHGDYRQLGRTRDDAAGEAFDKVARVLRLGYPGGPVIEQAAKDVNNPRYLPRAWLKGSDDFSFSGLKTAVLHMARALGIIDGEDPQSNLLVKEVAAGFQESIVDVLVTKTINAATRQGARQILIAGGVAANLKLRRAIVERTPLEVLIPPPILCTDNAAMIAACGYFKLIYGAISDWDLDVNPSLSL